MTAHSYHDDLRPGLLARLQSFGAGVLDALVFVAESNPRFRELERLSAMSDEALASRGLRREDLVQHVFRIGGYI